MLLMASKRNIHIAQGKKVDETKFVGMISCTSKWLEIAKVALKKLKNLPVKFQSQWSLKVAR